MVFSRDCLLKSRASTLSSLSSSMKSLKRGVFTLDDISCQVSVSQSVNQSVSPSVQKSASKPHTLQPRNPLRWPMRNLFASAGAGQNSTYIETASALRTPKLHEFANKEAHTYPSDSSSCCTISAVFLLATFSSITATWAGNCHSTMRPKLPEQYYNYTVIVTVTQ